MAFTKDELQEFLEVMRNYRARHTELITVYVPNGMDINLITRQLEAEKSTAANIKSTTTRKNVEAALESLIRITKGMRQAPKNGIALFAGNVSQIVWQDNFLVEAIEPPEEINVRLYRCDQTFVLEPLEEMNAVKEVYGLVVIERKEATIGLLIGKKIKILRHLESFVPGKIKAGGQSAARFARITEGLAKEFFRRVADSMKEIFFDMPRLKGILVGGPIPTKEEFLRDAELVTKLKEKVIAIKDLGYTDEHGLKLLVEASEEDISQQELIKEKNIISKFFETLGKHKEKATYGKEKTQLALQRGAVDLLLLSKTLPKSEIQELEKAAEKIGANVVIISVENQEGEQFLNLTKGIGAVLRFAIE